MSISDQDWGVLGLMICLGVVGVGFAYGGLEVGCACLGSWGLLAAILLFSKKKGPPPDKPWLEGQDPRGREYDEFGE
jgi:hypothetical protein